MISCADNQTVPRRDLKGGHGQITYPDLRPQTNQPSLKGDDRLSPPAYFADPAENGDSRLSERVLGEGIEKLTRRRGPTLHRMAHTSTDVGGNLHCNTVLSCPSHQIPTLQRDKKLTCQYRGDGSLH